MSDNNIAIKEEHRCLVCSGALEFDPESQTLMCVNCDASREPTTGVTSEAVTSGCPNCGAELTIITGSRQAKCDSCDSRFQMLQDGEDCGVISEIPENHRYIIPFTVSKENYQTSMIHWLANERGTPTDIFDKIAMIRPSEGIYLPYYYCVVSYNVKWTAIIGIDRIETYTAFETRSDSNGNLRTVPVTRTRIVTDWHPHSSCQAGRVTLGIEASNYLTQVHRKLETTNSKESLAGINDSSFGRLEPPSKIEIDQNFKHCNMQGRSVELQPLDTKYTASFRVLPCDIEATKVYDKQQVHNQIALQIKRNAPGDRIRDLNFSGDIIPDYFLVYRPYWASIYTYGKKICSGHSDGTNADLHYGTRPIDKDAKKLKRMLSLPFIISAVLTLVVSVVMANIGVDEELMMTIRTIMVWLTVLTGLFALAARGFIRYKNKKLTVERSQNILGNTSKVFQRMSAAPDPTTDL